MVGIAVVMIVVSMEDMRDRRRRARNTERMSHVCLKGLGLFCGGVVTVCMFIVVFVAGGFGVVDLGRGRSGGGDRRLGWWETYRRCCLVE